MRPELVRTESYRRKRTSSAVCYGDSRNSQGTLATDKLFTGQRLDGTGLYYYGARYYDPSIGRFISADTMVGSLMNPQALNRYSYVLNNPLRYVDPTGHATGDLSWSVAGGWTVENSGGQQVSVSDTQVNTAVDSYKSSSSTTWSGFVSSGNSGLPVGSGSPASGSAPSLPVDRTPSVPAGTSPSPAAPPTMPGADNKPGTTLGSNGARGAGGAMGQGYQGRGNSRNADWYGFGQAMLGTAEVVAGCTGIILSVSWTAATFVETGGASAMIGVPVFLLSYNALQQGLQRISMGEIKIPDIPPFPFPF